MKKFSVAIIIGTRPEGIKLYPLIRNFKSRNCFETIVIATGQHDELIKQVFELFNFEPDYNFDLMHENQSLSALSYRLISSLTACFNQLKPDLVIVQGDTTSAFIAALSAYYTHTKIAHVEAGLRTFDKSAPFPEEINRTLISHIADFHFAPTENARANLINEGINSKNIVVTGNTIIDAIKLLLPEIKKKDKKIFKKKLIFATAHRRENFGQPFANISLALQRLSKTNRFKILLPIHPNPQVKNIFSNIANDNLRLVDPLDYRQCINFLNQSYLVLTDSGGLVEECAFLGKPVFILREKTERVESVQEGIAKIIGTDPTVIYDEVLKLFHNKKEYKKMACSSQIYGDGTASEKIVNFIWKRFVK